MKINKNKFKIKEANGVFNIYFLDHPLTKEGFPTEDAAKKRLDEYINRINQAN